VYQQYGNHVFQVDEEVSIEKADLGSLNAMHGRAAPGLPHDDVANLGTRQRLGKRFLHILWGLLATKATLEVVKDSTWNLRWDLLMKVWCKLASQIDD
jgi:hypothetical protein